jgi:hypothetical protein
MSDQKDSNRAATSWPNIDEAYVDELGPIDPEVYEIAGKLWPAVLPFVRRATNDIDTALTLMLKAVAITSRRRNEVPDRITELKSYLDVVFKRLLMREINKRSRNETLNENIEDLLSDLAQSQHEIEHDIFVREVMAHADAWTRGVLEWRILGYSFEELAPTYGMKANHLRSKWNKSVSRLRKRLKSDRGNKGE